MYKEQLTAAPACLIEPSVVDHAVNEFKASLDEALEQVNKNSYEIKTRNTYLTKKWSHMTVPSETSVSDWTTGCDTGLLKFIGNKSVTYPQDFVSRIFFPC